MRRSRCGSSPRWRARIPCLSNPGRAKGRERFGCLEAAIPKAPRWGSGSSRDGTVRDLTCQVSARPPVLDAGKELFRALVQGEVSSLFHASLGSLRGRSQGLRIDIAIDPRRAESAALQTLPWEPSAGPRRRIFSASAGGPLSSVLWKPTVNGDR